MSNVGFYKRCAPAGVDNDDSGGDEHWSPSLIVPNLKGARGDMYAASNSIRLLFALLSVLLALHLLDITVIK